MRIAYLLLVHKNIEQLELLIKQLDCSFVDFYIHLDPKTPDIGNFRNECARTNVFILPEADCVDIKWGGYSMIKATIALLKLADKLYKKSDRIYFILLSGADFPLKSNTTIFDQLNKSYGTEFIEHSALPYSEWTLNGGLDRLFYHWFIDEIGYKASYELYLFQKSKNRKRFEHPVFRLYGGSQWWCLTRKCISYILNSLNENNQWELFRQSFIPDETLFQTIIMNGPFEKRAVNNNLRYINWTSGPDYPKILTLHDWDSLSVSAALFARKIEGAGSAELLQRLMTSLGGTIHPSIAK